MNLFLRYQILALVALVAVICFKAQERTPPPFDVTIGGVGLQMTRLEVDTLLGEESQSEDSLVEYVLNDSLFSVSFDKSGRVERVVGNFLEIDGIAMKPASLHDSSFFGRLEKVIGKADRGSREASDSWSSHSRYSKMDLTVSSGCGGLYFRLGADPNEPEYVAY